MIFRRKIYETLLKWKQTAQGKSALLIEGARRIGKSTVVEAFAKNEYESYLLVNFSKINKQIRAIFEDGAMDLDLFFMRLCAHFRNVELKARKSVIIFDEVQLCPQAREMIKFLVEDGRYDYIETGSLISIRENVRSIVIPSEERSVKMYPMDFEEFLAACGETALWELIAASFVRQTPLPDELHKKAMLCFRQYLLVGGMPKSVDEYLVNRMDLNRADLEKRAILELYRNDIMKIQSRYRSKVLSLFDQIPGFLSQHEKRVRLNAVAAGTDAESYHESFFWLADSMVANECFACCDPNVGLSLNEERSAVKCYMNDTGLLISHAFDENALLANDVYAHLLSRDLSINEGMFFENAVAQLLVAGGHKLYFYAHYNEMSHRNDIEIDFLISNGDKADCRISPIEVKSGLRYKTVSLQRFMAKFKDRIANAFVIHPRNLKIKDGVVYLPIYMTGLL